MSFLGIIIILDFGRKCKLMEQHFKKKFLIEDKSLTINESFYYLNNNRLLNIRMSIRYKTKFYELSIFKNDIAFLIAITGCEPNSCFPTIFFHSYLESIDFFDEFKSNSTFFKQLYPILKREIIRGYGV